MDPPVVVVGAGPTGLMLAGELRLAGAEVLVIDRLERPSGESRGLGFTPRTMEVFDQRGLLDRYGPISTSAQGHFGGLPVDFSVFHGAHFSVRDVPQHRTEAVLGEWVAELGVEVRRGTELRTLEADDDGVTLGVLGPSGEAGGLQQLRASYLVGCDGGRSTVRRLAGFAFPGTASTMEMFLADVGDCDIEARPIGESLPRGMAMSLQLGERVHRIIVCERAERGTAPVRRTGPPEFSEVAAAWQRLTGQDIGSATPLWISAFGNAARQVTEYRRGRVLLAGDAAHIHLPAGGQGMNTGVQDAVNLGWKLAAVARGTAPPDLLDSYHRERHPVGARLLMNTQAQGLLFLSGSEVQPLRDVLSGLMRHRAVGRHLAGMVSGLDIHYDLGPGSHPLLGLRLPRLELRVAGADTATTTGALLSSGRALLLDLADDPELRRAADGWSGRLDVLTVSTAPPLLSGTDALLVRPDGQVAWASPGSPGGVRPELRRWFGPPRSHRGAPNNGKKETCTAL
ncbi:FAD-dependent monooxygenase [Kitasatospora phosalacinea]|uniref:FAD-dependent monooxygenase n=1 Tax=Kitasatospora phosalacinea TaxID=2065 RepID=UPI0035DABE4E